MVWMTPARLPANTLRLFVGTESACPNRTMQWSDGASYHGHQLSPISRHDRLPGHLSILSHLAACSQLNAMQTSLLFSLNKITF
jgi:uncharacterized protein (DUF2235 family)